MDKWHLDEVVVTIKGKQYYLWRAVDADGNVLDTDKLKSYEAANKQVLKSVEHRQHKGLNNRAENSHQPQATSTHCSTLSPTDTPTT